MEDREWKESFNHVGQMDWKEGDWENGKHYTGRTEHCKSGELD